MLRRKPDADKFEQLVRDLETQDWIQRSERRWWPRFVFHYTDIKNAVSILREGIIYSRLHMEQHDGIPVTSGSHAVLAGTQEPIKDCVRLYFRPKTPTQYHMEGIYSKQSLSTSQYPDAHCPVPIFFLFDSLAILTRSDTQFSDGNLGSPQATLFSTADEFSKLPWQLIYHNRSFDPHSQESKEIILRRCAEILVPSRLDLAVLRYIYCRSSAERESLLFLLPTAAKNRYRNKIVASERSEFYFRRQTFIEQIRLSSDRLRIQFSPETKSPGPFNLHITIRSGGSSWEHDSPTFDLRTSHVREFLLREPKSYYQVEIFLDDHLAYAGKYEDTSMPF